ncbi:hypothetical protein B0H13DRAFT_2327919 [Mycena leptocephala]|nr:hypothetical protein B0H13DRAFT_2327919 [Mycena leptocephala]
MAIAFASWWSARKIVAYRPPFGVDMKVRQIAASLRSITVPTNSRFVLHDSMGFEPGNVKKLQDVKTFISKRSGTRVSLKERVHAIWCLALVVRALETGDEEIVELALLHKVPVVVVFTQHDRLLSMINIKLPEPGRTPEEIHKLCAEKAQPIFHDWVRTSGAFFGYGDGDKLICMRTGLSEKRPNPDREALYELVNTTCNLVQEDMGILAGLTSSAHFPGSTLQKCLETVHQEMTDSWNFYDPDDHLIKVKFMDQVKKIAQLATPDEAEAKSWFKSEDREAAQTWIGLAGAALAANAGPVIGALGVTAWFAKFVADLYHNTPETLRCFMAYLVDLTLVLHELFYVLPIASPRTVTEDNIAMAFERYNKSDLGRVHSEVRRYVSAGDWEREAAEKKMKELILYYSSPEHRARLTAK